MNDPLELRTSPKTKLVVSQHGEEVVVEILVPASLRDDDGWHLLSQITLAREHVAVLQRFLGDVVEEQSTRSGTHG